MARGVRWLWMWTPGLTEAVIREEAIRLKLISVVDFDGRVVEMSPNLNEFEVETVNTLRDACLARIGITDAEQYQRDQLKQQRGTLPSLQERYEEMLRTHPPVYRNRLLHGRHAEGRT